MLLRDQGEPEGSEGVLNASQAIFAELGDALWTARVLAGKALLAGLRGTDPVPMMRQAADICLQRGIAEECIASALREW